MGLGVPIRRKVRRISASTPVRFEWQTAGGDILRARGMTRNISTGGVYCYIEHPLAIGLGVEVDVLFPTELAGSQPQMFRCQGRVLRAEKLRSQFFGIAVSIGNHRVIDGGKLNRRAHIRVTPGSQVVAQYAGLRSAAIYMSLSGAFIKDPQPLPVGRQIELQLESEALPGKIVVEGIVRRVEPQVGMAVEFVELSVEADRWLREFLEKSLTPHQKQMEGSTQGRDS